MAQKIKIQGKELQEISHPLDSQFNSIVKSFSLDAARAGADIIDIGAQDDDIIGLEFDDGGEWIGHIEDIHQIFGEHIQVRGGDNLFPGSLNANQNDRGLKEIGIKILNLIRGQKKISEAAARLIAQQVDKKVMSTPGLFKVTDNGDLKPATLNTNAKKYLLYLHGTLSSFNGSFGDLYLSDDKAVCQAIHQTFGECVLALQHYTLSASPWENALEILNRLPQGTTLDIISHSRGGLIADILASCDHRNGQIGYNEAEISLANGDDALVKTLKQITKLAKQKSIRIDKVIRVACPARGTTLLSNSLDHFLNGLLRAVGLAFGGKTNTIYQYIRGLICDVISARLTPGVMPGILAMVPDSIPQQLINRAALSLKNHLVVIEGDSEAGAKFWRSVLVVLSNLYYREENDFVVNTSSMRYGALRDFGLQFFRSQDETTSHFNYFKNQNTRDAILDAILTPAGLAINRFEQRNSSEIDRGVFIDLFKKYKAISYETITGQKPIVLLIPGVMGTHLRIGDDIVWIDLGEIGKGRMVSDLPSSNKAVDTKYIIGEFYGKLVEHLQPTHDIYTFGYDWRLTLSMSAARLESTIADITVKAPGQPISIIAHSMGGLVVRDMMRLHATSWAKYIAQKNNRVLLLGTPWLGSHLIMEVFTGHQSRVRQINLMDTHHDRDALIRVFNNYEGLYDLLPVNNEDFETVGFWNTLNASLGKEKVLIPPLLNYFKNYKSAILSFNANASLNNIFYLAGKDDLTTCTYRIAKNIFGRRLQYLGTPEGDGSVTWALGIPKNLPTERLYYAYQTSHGNLANDELLFDGIRDIISIGATLNLEKDPPSISTDRSVIDHADYQNIQVMPEIATSNRSEEAIKLLQGLKPKKIRVKPKDEYIDVSVIHGDLKIAAHPVMVGHFKDDGIVTAEAAIDYYFDGKLSDRHRISYYPGSVGESLVLYDPNKNPPGAIIIGLGDVTGITPYFLRKAVEAGVIRYAMHFRDNLFSSSDTIKAGQETSISCLCIGTGYGSLTMEASMAAILSGVIRANQIIGTIRSLKPIKTIEFIELYEHIAQNAYYQLSQLEHFNSANLTFRLKKGIIKKTGARRKFQFSIENSWWHNLTSRIGDKDKSPRIAFTSSSGIARVEEENTFTSRKIIDGLLDQMAVDEGVWNKEYSKTLFEILIPNPFKEILRHQNNVLWKMDIETASYPWELMHDHEIDQKPTFVRAGLIRQLYTKDLIKAEIIHNQSALVIADPEYSSDGPQQLPGANKEGQTVSKILKDGGFDTVPLIRKKGLEILNHLYNHEYKILHVAGHGTISEKNINETGIVLDNGMYITPGMLRNMSKLPEFVFVNCCYSGTVEPGKEKLYQQRYGFAANVGTQLISMGVHAVVVAGWPVNDDAALLFSKTFYDLMLAGKTFGDAVRQAREACWDKYEYANNTWGAYQCYGDQWYRMVSSQNDRKTSKNYFTRDQVAIDLYNLHSETRDRMIIPEALENKLNDILKNAESSQFIDSSILEMKANILSELNLIDKAIVSYEYLRALNYSDFSVKSLEQSCNLRMKHLLIKVMADKSIKPQIIESEIDHILKDLDLLIRIGTTPERLSILGSAHKKIAMIYESFYQTPAKQKLIKNHLTQALKYYTQACKAIDPKNLNELNYPITNILTIHAIISKVKSIQLHEEKPKLIKNIFLEIKRDLMNSTEQNIDFWQDVNLVNILQSELFYASEKELDSIKSDIVRLYSHAWTLSGTYRQKQTKLEHLDFLQMGVRVIERPAKWKKQLKDVLEALSAELRILK
ncbi:MAG: CHAT domain-containing protein [Saprospiraceae bacterium]|nr:CHAT domain-containing protein [Saprospiraceae bacterium]